MFDMREGESMGTPVCRECGEDWEICGGVQIAPQTKWQPEDWDCLTGDGALGHVCGEAWHCRQCADALELEMEPEDWGW